MQKIVVNFSNFEFRISGENMTFEEARQRAQRRSSLLQKRYFVVLLFDGTHSACSSDVYHEVMRNGRSNIMAILDRFSPKGV